MESVPPAAKNLFKKRFFELQKTSDMCFLYFNSLSDGKKCHAPWVPAHWAIQNMTFPAEF